MYGLIENNLLRIVIARTQETDLRQEEIRLQEKSLEDVKTVPSRRGRGQAMFIWLNSW